MCSPEVLRKVSATLAASGRLDRRRFVGVSGAAVIGAAAWHGTAGARQATPQAGATPVPGSTPGSDAICLNFSTIVDLSHVHGPEFPMFPGAEQMSMEVIVTIEADGFFKNRLTFDEHTGTHLDAPAHFDPDGDTADLLPPENFFAPLAVIDISRRADADPDTAVSRDDLLAWEAVNGQLPAGAFVAMSSGWAARIANPASYINLGADGVPHFPGFDLEAAEFLLDEREIVGIGVDTLSQDPGNSTDFATHVAILGAGKYGIENLNNLDALPPSGATVIIGAPKHLGASGGPARVFAVY
ncbi:MAG: cyclase family protein [Chloroflexia bacterium]|nr:cyclase family protein [Chloroflexia bacterium]